MTAAAAPEPAPSGVAQHAHAGYVVEQGCDHALQGRGVRGQVRFDIELAAGEQDRDAVVADGSGDEHGVAGPDLIKRKVRKMVVMANTMKGDGPYLAKWPTPILWSGR